MVSETGGVGELMVSENWWCWSLVVSETGDKGEVVVSENWWCQRTGGVGDLMVLETWMGCSYGLLELDDDWRGWISRDFNIRDKNQDGVLKQFINLRWLCRRETFES